MKGFIVYPTYKTRDGGAFIHLFGRLENGESFLTISSYLPYFFIRKRNVARIKAIKTGVHFNVEETKLRNFREEAVVKILLALPSDVPKVRDALRALDIKTYESDIRFVYRYMMDRGIKGSLNIQGEYERGEQVDRIYREPEITGVKYKPKLKVLSIDIECAMDLKKLYAVSLYGKDISKVLIVSGQKLQKAESFQSERDLLERFRDILLEYDPDIITGWNLIDFDLKIIKQKFDEHGLPFVLGRDASTGSINTYNSFFRPSRANIAGRMVLDAMQLLRMSYINLTDYKLQTAAEEILGDSKSEQFEGMNKGEEIERLYKKEPQKLVDYNLKDAELVVRILEKKGIIDLSIERSLLTGMQLDRTSASIASLDNLYLRESRRRGYVAPTTNYRERGKRITGGFVRDSVPGIYDNIIVLDFKSLYPSIIRTFNIDPLAYVPQENKGQFDQKSLIAAPNSALFKKSPGILPQLIQELWEQRDRAKKEQNEIKSYAIKITMNSFFGVLANPVCRFYSLKIANAITYFGRFIVKKTAELVEEHGYRVIYGDTDSIFVETKARKTDRAMEIGEEIQALVNRFWRAHIAEEYGVDCFLELEFEKTYVKFMMPKIRGTDKGAKKRYAGLLIKDGKEKIDFTGLEFVRRDWTGLAKKFQAELLEKIFHEEIVSEYIKAFVEDLKKGKYDDLLVYKKAIRKNLKDYTKTTPPHVKAGRKLASLSSNIISYVMTVSGPEPVQDIRHRLDYEHYIEKQVKPIADSLLVFYGQTFQDVLKGTKQTSLHTFDQP